MTADLIPVQVRKSNIHGMGCFAAAPIDAETSIIEYTGELIDHTEAVRRADRTYSKHSEYVLHIDGDVYVDGIAGSAARYENHSCEPNCYLWAEGNRVFIRSLKPIQIGEEITYDYMYDVEYREPCACNAPTCRGYI